MWYLSSSSDPRIIYILPDKEIVVGRSVDTECCNFAIPDDSSISRKHASLSVSGYDLILQDLGSKYGTFINNFTEKLESGTKHKINIGDNIKFGKLSSEWKTHFINLTSCTSTLKGECVKKLKENLNKLGGTLKNDWDSSCGYLTMPAITLTIKVVLALVQGSYIVNTEFWNKCVEATAKLITLPDPKNYMPQIIESILNKETVSFLPDEKRKTLFAGKTFIFFSRRQLDMYKNVLINSSASALLLSETKLTKSMLCEGNKIVIQYNLISTSQESQVQRNQINDLVNYLKSKGKRVIADAEIGLAILYCSSSKYCNPDFNFPTEVIKKTSSESVTPANILAHESEDPLPSGCKQEKVVIDESLNSKVDISTSNDDFSISKRKRVEEDMEMANPNKKVAIDKDTKHSETSNSAKRTYEDSDGMDSNPVKKIAIETLNEDNDFFNFTASTSTRIESSESKKLNLMKPLKRKQDFVDDEDDNLFNFVEDNPKPTKILRDTLETERTIWSKHNNLKEENNINSVCEKFEISALRGIKLDELMQSNLKMEYKAKVKSEDDSGLDEKLNNLDLGSTTIILRSDLIVKKEPVQLNSDEIKVKNFKKFKKVWPIKMQISIISKSSAASHDGSDKNNILSNIAL
ncbi:Nibrin [Papilio xuthus]|uniref:Nibrin n=1 Tax=Papilio xuthus TaxID=66420 RepID=A0A194QH56_PAPXU|nr:Nibrin [Papilio xuthus]